MIWFKFGFHTYISIHTYIERKRTNWDNKLYDSDLGSDLCCINIYVDRERKLGFIKKIYGYSINLIIYIGKLLDETYQIKNSN